MPKATYKQLRPGVAPMLENIPAIFFDLAAAKQMGTSVAQSCCHWTEEKGLGSKRKECFLPCVRLKLKFSLKITATIPT